MQVFTRERLNGYYGISQFAVANTLSSVPFIFVITVISTLCVYYLAALNTDSDRVIYFILDLFLSLLVVRALINLLIINIAPVALIQLCTSAVRLHISNTMISKLDLCTMVMHHHLGRRWALGVCGSWMSSS